VFVEARVPRDTILWQKADQAQDNTRTFFWVAVADESIPKGLKISKPEGDSVVEYKVVGTQRLSGSPTHLTNEARS
jgi:hypothetical protein